MLKKEIVFVKSKNFFLNEVREKLHLFCKQTICTHMVSFTSRHGRNLFKIQTFLWSRLYNKKVISKPERSCKKAQFNFANSSKKYSIRSFIRLEKLVLVQQVSAFAFSLSSFGMGDRKDGLNLCQICR